MQSTLLTTKLHRPRALPQQVQRPQLLARLDQGLAAGLPLTLVVAPAGFGKSTLISQWLDDLRLTIDDFGLNAALDNRQSKIVKPKSCWLSLDEYDNDLPLFLHYLVAAVRQIVPVACSRTLNLLQAPQLPPSEYLTHTLLHDLSALDQPFILVLEDYHCLAATVIHQLLSRLLTQMPDSMHLVLISRTEPPLPLARLRVRQQMTELRAADLCFSTTETQTLLTQTLGRLPSAETVATLHTQTEGWAAGLHLAALALRGRADETAFVQSYTASHRHVTDYLMEEVIARQPPDVQTFLLRTSILDRFCAPLCEAFQSGESPAIRRSPLDAPLTTLTYLIQANLFLVPLDEQGEWYRYHHLFRDLLRRRLRASASPAEVAALYGLAGAWLADHGWIEEAIQYALAGGDERAAAHLVAQDRHELLNREEWRTLERRLALLPDALVQQHAALLMTKALVLNLQFKLAAIPPLLQAVADALWAHLPEPTLAAADAQVLQGEMDALWSQHWYWQQEGQRSLAAAEQALARLPADYLYARSGALLYLGLAAQMTGQATVAVQTLRAALEEQQASPSTFVTRILYALAFIHYLGGELTLTQQMAAACLQVARQNNLALTLGWAHYLLGCVYYEWNELATAAQHFTAVVALRYRINGLTAHHGWLGLAWTQQAQGRPDQAQHQVAALLHFHHEMNHLAFLPLVHSFQARLALQQGDGATALRWAQTVALDPIRTPLPFPEIPQLTRAKIVLAQAAPKGAPLGAGRGAEVLVALAPLRQVAEATHNPLRLIELLALQALAEAAQGRTESALATLHQAVMLAQPGRFIRTFVDLGPRLAALLYQLAAPRGLPGVETAYLGQVLAAFPPTAGADDLAYRIRQASQAHGIEPLTERESEVLLHLHKGLPNKAIADALHISLLTVKRHTTNIFQKLGVETRKQAVVRARALGILPPHTGETVE